MASVFTRIIEGEIPAYKIYEDEKTIAFLDIDPKAEGHTLVVPKIEIDKFYELPEEYYVAVFDTAKRLAAHFDKVLGKRVFLKVIGTDVPHVHIHLIPQIEDYPQKPALEEADFVRVSDLLRYA